MPLCHRNGLKYFQFTSFDLPDLKHGIFTRQGGISPIPWASLNVGGMNGDSRENVIENRRRIFDCCNLPVESIFDVWQVHGTKVICSEHPRRLEDPHQEADGIVTSNPEVTLFMRFGDCVPLMFFDPGKRVVGLAHAGWKGTVNQIARVMIHHMQEEYGCFPDSVYVGIGPSIAAHHYEIGKDVYDIFRSQFGYDICNIIDTVEGKIYLDLWRANEIILHKSGVQKIEISEICTACHVSDWFSHRMEHGKTGRFGALISLQG